MTFFLALSPLILILYLMIGRRWGAAPAGGAGYLSTLFIAWLFFGAGPELVAYAHGKAILLSLDVLLIIWAAFLLYRVADEAGAIQTIGRALPHLTPDPGMQALLIGWVFASFLQGVGGFGVPVAVTAPILIGLGFAPLAAVIIPTIGHGWAVTFGSLGSAYAAMLAATGLSNEMLAPASAFFLGAPVPVIGLMVAHAAGGWAAVRRLWAPVILLGSVMAVTQYLAATAGVWNIASFAGSAAGLLVGMPLAVRNRKARTQEMGVSDGRGRSILSLSALGTALSGYAVLVVVILIVQLVPALRSFLGQAVIHFDFPEVRTGLGYVTLAESGRDIPIFRHTGSILAYASILTYFVYKRAGLYKPGAPGRITTGTLGRVWTSTLSILAMVAMAVIMEDAGMTDTLAGGLAESVGALFPVVAPWIGAVGAFITGSNTNSNVLFSGLQTRTAGVLGYSLSIILAAQNAGAALTSVISPTKVVVGVSTAGMTGQEGLVMRKMFVYTGLLMILISALTAAGVLIRGGF